MHVEPAAIAVLWATASPIQACQSTNNVAGICMPPSPSGRAHVHQHIFSPATAELVLLRLLRLLLLLSHPVTAFLPLRGQAS
jgi:hypothetical protein